jgi:hypothetical protein
LKLDSARAILFVSFNLKMRELTECDLSTMMTNWYNECDTAIISDGPFIQAGGESRRFQRTF